MKISFEEMIRFLAFLSFGNALEVFFNVSTNGLNQIGIGTWSLHMNQRLWPQAMTPKLSFDPITALWYESYGMTLRLRVDPILNVKANRATETIKKTIHMYVLILIGGLMKNAIMEIAVGLVME